MEDFEILELYRDRDESAIKETKEKYGKRLYGLSYSIVKDSMTAGECENDTYMKAWDSIPPHDPKNYFYAFLARIIRHISLDCIRKNQALKRSSYLTELSDELEQCLPSHQSTEGDIEDKMLGEAINSFLGSLKAEKRKIFVRRYFFLEDISSVAKQLGISVGKVKSVLFRCRKELREHLERQGFYL